MEIINTNSPRSIITKQTLNQYTNYNHPGEYHSPYDVKMTIKNIFVIFNNFKKILNEGFKFSRMNGFMNNKRMMGAQELLPVDSSSEVGTKFTFKLGKLEVNYFHR